MNRHLGLAIIAVGVIVSRAGAQSASTAAMDSLLGHLVGTWRMTGTVRGRPVEYRLDARRVLRGQFVELHMVDVARPPTYEARVFLGVDSAGHRYVVHWLDGFGATYSIPPGFGEASGDTVRFSFAYADGPFRDLFAYDDLSDTWYVRLESGDTTGHWSLFAEYQVRRRRAGPLPN